MVSNFIEWLEKDVGRTRKVVLVTTVFVFLLITISIFGVSFFGIILQQTIITLYGTLSALMVSIFGFFTGTSSDKTTKLADKAADILMSKLKPSTSISPTKYSSYNSSNIPKDFK